VAVFQIGGKRKTAKKRLEPSSTDTFPTVVTVHLNLFSELIDGENGTLLLFLQANNCIV